MLTNTKENGLELNLMKKAIDLSSCSAIVKL